MAKHREATPSTEFEDALWAFGDRSIDTMFDAYETWMDGWFRVQDESLRYCRDVVTRNLDAATSLAACKSPTEAFDVQMQYTGDAIGDYLHEGRRMIAMLDPSSSRQSPRTAAGRRAAGA